MDAKHRITTYSNLHFDPLQAREADVRICDIAHALSLICRANGHFKVFYSVAQHSVHCALEAAACGFTKQTQLHCLLHDAAEAYLGDVTRPVKRYFPLFAQEEEKLQRVIYAALKVDPPTEPEQQEIKRIDDRLLYHEFLVYHGSEVWDKAPPLLISLPAGEIPHQKAEQAFLRLFSALRG